MQQHPFTLPLTRDQFVAALHKGHGRALMHLRTCGSAGLDDAIIDACLTCRAFDVQVEGDRSSWLLELIDASDDPAALLRQIVPRLDEPGLPFWDANQRASIAGLLAARGDLEARERLYRCLRKASDCFNIMAVEQVLDLDGRDGVVRLAKAISGLLASDSTLWFDFTVFTAFDATYGTGAAHAVLAEVASSDRDIARVLDLMVERQDRYLKEDAIAESRQNQLQELTASQFLSAATGAGAPQVSGWFTSIGRQMRESELRTVLDALVTMADPLHLANCLLLFVLRPLSDFDTRLLGFIFHADQNVRWRSFFAVSHYEHPAIRAAALAYLSESRFNGDAIPLLRMNFRPGDSPLLQRALGMPTDPHDIHSMGREVLQVFQAHPVAEGIGCYLSIYEQSPCSDCRSSAVRLLVSTGTAPAWLLDECAADGSDDVRRAARGEPDPD